MLQGLRLITNMKILFENWRRYIKEARPQPLQQRILHDVGGYSGDVTPGKYDDEKTLKDRQRSTVGYGADENLIDGVKVLMDKAPQDWMIITAKNIGAVENFNSQDRKTFLEWFDGWIKEWLDKRNKPENFLDDTIFLVVQSPQLKGDEKGSQWFVHDVLGHSIYYIYEKTPSNYKPSFNSDFINYVQQKINGPGTADFDRLPDVFAAIILGNLSQEQMNDYGKNYLDSNQDNTPRGPAIRPRSWAPESVNSTITGIFDYTDWFVNKFLKRGPKNLNFVELWNPTDPNNK